jgi:hypothetical protein
MTSLLSPPSNTTASQRGYTLPDDARLSRERVPAPHMEEIEDEDAPPQDPSCVWSGEESFWLDEEDVEEEFDDRADDNTYLLFHEIADPEGEDQTDDDGAEEAAFNSRKGTFVFPPTRAEAEAALSDMKNILKPPRKNGKAYKSSGLDGVTRTRLEGIKMFLGTFIQMEKEEPEKRGNWTKASKLTTYVRGESQYYAKKLREWAREFIDDRKEIPENRYGRGNKSAIDDEDLSQEIHLHLQTIGKYIKAEDIVQYCGTAEMLERLKRTKSISLATAR